MVLYRHRPNLSKQQFDGELVSHEKMLPLVMVAKAQDQSLNNQKQPWYHISAFLFVASWKMLNEVIQKLKYLRFLPH